MEPEYVSFEQLDREHREERLRDAERVRKGEITPEQLQAENSFIPAGAKVTIVDLKGYLERAYFIRQRQKKTHKKKRGI